MRGILLSSLLLSAALTPAATAAAAGDPLLAPVTWREDFESGDISGWGSYPAFEDTAFDFTILPGRHRPASHLQGFVASGEYFYPIDLAPPQTGGKNEYYLLRSYRPNSPAAQRVGVMRPLWLAVGESGGEVAFHYWLQAPAGETQLRVDLAGGDGKRYSAWIDRPAREAWQRVELPLGRFSAEGGGKLEPGTAIEAIAIEADIPRGNPSMYVFLALDEVAISVARQAGFAVREPRVESFKNWPMLFAQRHYRPGDMLRIQATPDVEGMRAVTARLENLAGRTLAGPVDVERGAADLHEFTAADPRGPMMVVLEGRDARGRIARTEMRIWHLDKAATGHPRVLVSEADRARLRRAIESGEGKRAWDALVKQAAAVRASSNVPDQVQFGEFPNEYLLSNTAAWAGTLRQPPGHALTNAWVYWLGGDEEAGEFAKQTLLKMTGWDQWVHPWFQNQGRPYYFPVGLVTENLGLVYDLVAPLMTEQEKARARAGLLKNGIAPAFEEYFIDNRMPNSTSNWISHSTASPLMAVMAIYGETDSESMEPYFSGLAEKFFLLSKNTMRADGGYGEDWSYQNFTFLTAQAFLAGLQKMFGVEGLAQELHYTLGHLYPMYASFDGGKMIMAMGDSHEGNGAGERLVWFAGQSDPQMKWFYKAGAGNGWQDLLWNGPAVAAAAESPENLPLSRIFPLKGNMVFRSGWGERDTLVNFRAGANYNHTHFDMGNFRMRALGEELVPEANYSSYYTDPYFWSYFTQAGGHNLILVDDMAESQYAGDFLNDIEAFNRYARMETHLATDRVSFVRAELAPVYRAPMEAMTRRMWFVQPGYLVVHDRAKSAGGAHKYHWQMHTPGRDSLEIGAAGATVTGENAALQVAVLAPANAELKMREWPISVTEVLEYPATPLRPRAAFQVVNREPAEEAEFLVALLPREISGGEARVERIDADGLIGASIGREGTEDRFLFAENGNIRDMNIEAEAEAFFARRQNGELTLAGVEQARRINLDGQAVFQSDTPINIGWWPAENGSEWTLEADGPATVELVIPPAARITVEGAGKEIAADPARAGTRKISVRAGTTRVSVKH